MEPILAHWERFAATLEPAAANMGSVELREEAQQMLLAVATDLQTPQTREAQLEKSWGQGSGLIGVTETAARTHGFLRARAGFTVNQRRRISRAACKRAALADGRLRAGSARV